MAIASQFLFFLVKLAVSAVLLVLVLQGIDLYGAQARIASASSLGLIAALMCGILQIALSAWRWLAITELLCGVRMPLARTTGVAALSILAGQLLPSTIGGDVVRVGFVARMAGIGPATRCVVADRIVGLLALAAIALASTAILALSGLHRPALLIPAGLALAGLAAAAVLAATAPWRARLPAWLAALAAPASDLGLLVRSPRVPLMIGLSVLVHLLSIAMFLALASAISFEEVTRTKLALFVSPALLISTVPVSIGGWGLREGALSVGLAMAGASGEGPVILSVLFGLTLIGSSIVASPCWFVRQGPVATARD